MNRFFVLAIVAICLLSNTVALRGALFRSGRSMLHRQNIVSTSLNQPHLLASEKRSPIVELYPLVDSGSPDPEFYSNFFRF